MELRYKLSIKEQFKVSIEGDIDPFCVDSATVSWITEDSSLKGALISFKQLPLNINNGIFNPIYPDIHKEAYKTATYLSNRLLGQVGLDAFYSPQTILNSTPTIILESTEEEAKWKECVKQFYRNIPCTGTVVYPFNTKNYPENYKHSKVYSYYADAMRVSSPFLKYELLYMIVEYFFADRDNSVQDADVSSFAKPKNSCFDEQLCEKLRQMRNKITHPHAKKGHVNPENLEDIIEVHSLLKNLRILVKLILESPPE